MNSLEQQIAYMAGVAEKALMVAVASNTAVSNGRSNMLADVLASLRELQAIKDEPRKLLEGFGPNFDPACVADNGSAANG